MADKVNMVDPCSLSGIYFEKDESENKTCEGLCSSNICIGIMITVGIVLVTSIVSGMVFFGVAASNSVQMYHNIDKDGTSVVNQDIKIDTEKNTVIFHLSGNGIEPGTYAVIDYAKSLIGFYVADINRCYLIGGIQMDLPTPKDFKDILDRNNSQSDWVNETLEYAISSSYPVSDKSFLPAVLRSSCADIPVFWLEPIIESTTSTSPSNIQIGRQKRFTIKCRRCFRANNNRVCQNEKFQCNGDKTVCQGVQLPAMCQQWQQQVTNEQ